MRKLSENAITNLWRSNMAKKVKEQYTTGTTLKNPKRTSIGKYGMTKNKRKKHMKKYRGQGK